MSFRATNNNGAFVRRDRAQPSAWDTQPVIDASVFPGRLDAQGQGFRPPLSRPAGPANTSPPRFIARADWNDVDLGRHGLATVLQPVAGDKFAVLM